MTGVLLLIGFILASIHVEAQQPTKILRIGYLSTFDRATDSNRFEAIRLALRELGYIEGRNIVIEHRYGEGNAGRFPELAAELVRLNVDIIVVSGGGMMIRSAMNATKAISLGSTSCERFR